MYSTNTNQQQDGRRQAPNFTLDPKGGNFVLHIEDDITDSGRSGLAIYSETIQKADHETPAARVATLINEFIASNPDTIGEVIIDTIHHNREGEQ